MLLGYNTNGWAHHDPLDACRCLAEIGYESVALTLDHGLLNPYAPRFAERLAIVQRTLADLNLRSVVETGARFLLDPWVKHEPTLVSASATDRQRRVDFLKHAIDAAAMLGSDCVSLWSGILRDGAADETALDRLATELAKVLEHAAANQVTIAFEPEPGMFIDTMSSFGRLLQWIDSPLLKLTLDLGHLYCLGEVPIADYIHRWAPRLANVHLEDMRAGVHEHLMFGEGEMQFPPILDALAQTNYRGGVHVELSRHSHEAPQAARQAYDFLRPIIKSMI